jgi:tRNA threonylcarbamoyladenosine biosynthesis protein TsaB
MLILAVDTSTRTGSLALLRDGGVLGQATVSSDDPYSNGFSPGVDSLLRESGVSLSQLDLFAVSAGPGSFTGLRIGLTAVKAWAEVFARPIAAVSALEAIAAAAMPGGGLPAAGLLVPVFDARRGQVFGAMYRYSARDPERLFLRGEEVVAGPAEFLQSVFEQSDGANPVTVVSPTPEVIETALAASTLKGARLERVSSTLAPMIGLLGYRKALRGETVEALGLDASYVRRTDAELKWKE